MIEFFNILFEILRISFFVAVPLIIVANAGLWSERSGVVNIALEGIMIMGAFVAAYVVGLIDQSGNTLLTGNYLFLVGMIIAAVSGMLLSILHAYASVNMKANQIISGTALNLFVPAFAVFFMNAVTGFSKVKYPSNDFFMNEVILKIFGMELNLSNIPILGKLFFTDTTIALYIGILVIAISFIVLYKTRFGLRLRACGEHPQAADSAGINVYKMRYAGVLISGALAGLGGFFYIVPITGYFAPEHGVAGYGFLALAVLISGQWNPKKIVLFGLFFGFITRIAAMQEIIPALRALDLDYEILTIIPYIITLIVLTFTSKNSAAPKSVGEPYDQGKR